MIHVVEIVHGPLSKMSVCQYPDFFTWVQEVGGDYAFGDMIAPAIANGHILVFEGDQLKPVAREVTTTHWAPAKVEGTNYNPKATSAGHC